MALAAGNHSRGAAAALETESQSTNQRARQTSGARDIFLLFLLFFVLKTESIVNIKGAQSPPQEEEK